MARQLNVTAVATLSLIAFASCSLSPFSGSDNGRGLMCAAGDDARGNSIPYVSHAGSESSNMDSRRFLPDVVTPDAPEINRYLSKYRTFRQGYLTKALARRQQYIPVVEPIFVSHGLPAELADLAMVESGFKPDARSCRGAVGMWQLLPSTARRYGLTVNGKVDERKDVIKSTEAAARHLVDLYERFGDWHLVLAAFNSGESAVSRAMASTNSKDFFHIARLGKLPRETREFVPRFLALAFLSRDITVYEPSVDYRFAANEEEPVVLN